MVGRRLRWLLAASATLVAGLPATVAAQGTDGSPAERDLMVIAELLPGRWDNGEQVDFEPRLKVPVGERHKQQVVQIERAAAALNRVTLTLALPNAAPRAVTLTPLDARTTRMDLGGGCTVLWQREAGQFGGTSSGCGKDGARWMLSPDHLWIGGDRYMRTTAYSCFVDMPGASGGRAIAFKRIGGLTLYDGGEIVWFDSPETPSRKLGLQLRNVHWAMNNAPGVFARDSLTLYLVERGADGEPHSLLYAFTSKGAPRIGVNGIWALANCAREAMTAAKPEF